MPTNQNRQPDGVGTGGGMTSNSNSGGNVVFLPSRHKPGSAFDHLTADLIRAQFRAGTLNPQILDYLLEAVSVKA